jgi:hypothetical protein
MRGMTCAFTKPTVVPTHSVWIGTSFWTTSVTRTSGGGGAGGSARLQPMLMRIATTASVVPNPTGGPQPLSWSASSNSPARPRASRRIAVCSVNRASIFVVAVSLTPGW